MLYAALSCQKSNTTKRARQVPASMRYSRDRSEPGNGSRFRIAPARGWTRAMNRILLSIFLLAALPSTSGAAASRMALEPRLYSLRDGLSEPTIRGVRLLAPEAVFAFYQARGFEPAWSQPDAGDQIHKAILSVELDGLSPARYHRDMIASLLAESKRGSSPEIDLELDILLSDAVASLVNEVRYGRVRPATLNPAWNIDPRQDAPPLPEALARIAASPSVSEGIEKEKLDHFIYAGL